MQRQRTLVSRPQPLAQFLLPWRPAAELVTAVALEILLQDVELNLPVAGAERVVVPQCLRREAVQLEMRAKTENPKRQAIRSLDLAVRSALLDDIALRRSLRHLAGCRWRRRRLPPTAGGG